MLSSHVDVGDYGGFLMGGLHWESLRQTCGGESRGQMVEGVLVMVVIVVMVQDHAVLEA